MRPKGQVPGSAPHAARGSTHGGAGRDQRARPGSSARVRHVRGCERGGHASPTAAATTRARVGKHAEPGRDSQGELGPRRRLGRRLRIDRRNLSFASGRRERRRRVRYIWTMRDGDGEGDARVAVARRSLRLTCAGDTIFTGGAIARKMEYSHSAWSSRSSMLQMASLARDLSMTSWSAPSSSPPGAARSRCQRAMATSATVAAASHELTLAGVALTLTLTRLAT
mmetsp:Transcript_15587/g.60956  ORF Transcript_15587/g.60956 Transcript_15587/m.60956 type:complete len:225 (+) Transcript_15587:1243-1917(+)